MNIQQLGNASLSVLATGAIAAGIEKLAMGDLKIGLILCGVGAVLFLVYELTPEKPKDKPSNPQ